MNQSYWIAVEDLGIPNRNGRIYTKEVIEKALEDPLVKEKLDTHTLFVEDIRDRRKNEDSLYDCDDLMEVNVSNIIGSVQEIKVEDNKVFCKIEFYEDLFKDDVKSISCRLAGYGDLLVDLDGYEKVSNYSLEKIIAGDAEEEKTAVYKSIYNALRSSKTKPPGPEDMAGKLMSVQDYLDSVNYTNPGPQDNMQYMTSTRAKNTPQDKEKK